MKQLSNKKIKELVKVLRKNGIPATTGDKMKEARRCRLAKKS